MFGELEDRRHFRRGPRTHDARGSRRSLLERPQDRHHPLIVAMRVADFGLDTIGADPAAELFDDRGRHVAALRIDAAETGTHDAATRR